jgi:UDP-glucose 4-epimerase
VAVNLITGGAGFIGSHLARILTAQGHDVVTVDNLSGGWRDNVTAGQFVEADLVTVDLDDLFETWRPDVVWHLAAYAAEGLSHWVREFNYQNNVVASARLISASVKHRVSKFMFASSMAVYGSQTPPFTEDMTPQPEDPYGIAKYTVEQDLKAAGRLFGLDYTILRPHNVYGPNQNVGDPYRNVVGIFMRQALAGEPLTVFGTGRQTRAFSYVSDIVRPMVAAVDTPPGRIYNIGGEEIVSIRHLAESVVGLFGGEIRHTPERFEVEHAWCDHTRAREDLDFYPTVHLSVGLPYMAEWVRKHGVRWSTPPPVELDRDLPVFWERYAFS